MPEAFTYLQVSVLSYGAWVTFGNQIGVPGMI